MSVKLDVEAVQTELGFGLYQIRSLVLILLPILVNAMHNSNYVFAAADVKYRCKVPECETEPPVFLPGTWGDWALPMGDAARCNRYTPSGDSYSSCTPERFSNNTEKCESWVYGSNESIVAEFDLACEDWKRTLVGTIHSAGIFTALTFIGMVSDRFGRLPVFVVTACSPAITGLARALSNSYYMYIAIEYIETVIGSGVYTTACVFVMETMPDDRRVLTSTLLPIFYSLGHVTLAGAAWVLPGWRVLIFALYLPSSIFVVYCLLLNDSPRWLVTRGRTQKASKILLRAAKINNVTFSPKIMQQLTEKSDANTTVWKESEKVNKTSLVSQVVSSKLLMCRLAMCGFWLVSCAFVFYGLSINSVSLAGNKYLNFMLTSIAEIPGYTLTLVVLDRFGRRTTIRTAFLLCGIALISMPFIPSEMSGVLLTLTLIGKLWISMAFGSLYIFTSELFPTQVRHSMLAASSMIGRIGQILAPQTPLLIGVWRPLPYAIFGALSITASLLTFVAPETRGSPLCDTVAETEEANKVRNT